MMIVLGIESSCDETAVAIVKDGNNVLSSVISSQVAKHAPYGGVIPEIAAREHLNAIGPLFNQAIKEADIDPSQIDLIATTQGPGLVGALLVGSTFAKGLGVSLGVPVLPVDHVHAHVHGALLGLPESVGSAEELFPALSLVVSGGHTNLYWMESPVQFRLLAATVDDACGECFDKVARMWNLPYPGGPVIEKMAKDGRPGRFKMPKMVSQKDKMIFSYSGLKTHLAYLCEREGPFAGQDLNDLAYAFQDEAFGQIARKISSGLNLLDEKPRSLLVAGGVAANKRFRDILTSRFPGISHYFPALTYCADNAAMIAGLGWYEFQKLKQEGKEVPSADSWDVYSRYRYELVTGDTTK